MTELQILLDKLEKAKGPEDIFGLYSDEMGITSRLAEARRLYFQLVRVCHPDKNVTELEAANTAFQILQKLYDQLQRAVQNGTYGRFTATTNPLIITRKHETYKVGRLFARGALANLYDCQWGDDDDPTVGLAKITRAPADNDLATIEAKTLKTLHYEKGYESGFEQFRSYLPGLYDSFTWFDGISSHHINIIDKAEGFYTLREVKRAYRYLNPKDMAWMFRRLLVVLGYGHQAGVVHNAVTPDHVMIHPAKHGLILLDWSYSVKIGDQAKAIGTRYRDWCPPEVTAKHPLTPATDLHMAASCMIYLLGGEPSVDQIPDNVPMPLRAFLRGCRLKTPEKRAQDAWALKDEEFDPLIEQMWGPRRFRPFSMPASV